MYVYGEVPPDVVLVNVTLFPVSIVVEEAEIVTVGSALTVTVTELGEDAVEPSESVTIDSTTYSPINENVITLPLTE